MHGCFFVRVWGVVLHLFLIEQEWAMEKRLSAYVCCEDELLVTSVWGKTSVMDFVCITSTEFRSKHADWELLWLGGDRADRFVLDRANDHACLRCSL